MYTQKTEKLKELFQNWKNCEKCKLAKTRKRIVFGDGNPTADLVVIGTGPGESEDLDGVPFIGESGRIINDYLQDVNFPRNEIFFMNIVQCRPVNIQVDTATGKKREENRDPLTPEREACRPFWQEMLYIVDPLLIIVMGKSAIIEVTGRKSVSMTDMQGLIDVCKISGRVTEVTYPVMSMFHPTFLARSGNMNRGGPWHKALVSWRRAIYFLDQMRHFYYGTPLPNRGFGRKEMFTVEEGIF